MVSSDAVNREDIGENMCIMGEIIPYLEVVAYEKILDETHAAVAMR